MAARELTSLDRNLSGISITTDGSDSSSSRPESANDPNLRPFLAHNISIQQQDNHSRGSGSSYGTRESESYAVVDNDGSFRKMDKPSRETVQEIVGLLKAKTSMLAIGACERVKKIARAWPSEVINSPIMPELLSIIKDGPGTPLAGASMSALATMALVPEGRQAICIHGGAVPLIKLVSRGEVRWPNTDKALALLMNLAADQQNRRMIREAGGVEAIITAMEAADTTPDHLPLLEHAMGALHNVMLADGKSRVRAVEAGIARPLVKVLTAAVDDNHAIKVRARLLMGELVKVPDMDTRFREAAASMGIRLPEK